ncbi:MAG: hypothetical protein JWP97_4363 [Labilithrix sp.]|nr:hypothetical protein [Labilithrix sp.]
MAEFVVTDAAELHALRAALIESKLPRLANDQDLAASPIVARLAERVSAACQGAPELTSVSERWRQFSPKHSYWAVAISRALADQNFLRASKPAAREDYVRCLIAPFRTDQPIVRDFLAELESILATRRWYHLWIRPKKPFLGGVAFLRQREDGSFVAHDSEHTEIVSSEKVDDVGEVLLERGLEPFGYFVEEV